MYFCILNLIIINLNFITMRKIFTLILAFTFIFGGLANAQQLKSIAKPTAKASAQGISEVSLFKKTTEPTIKTKGVKAITVGTVTCSSFWIEGTQTLNFTMTYSGGLEYMNGLEMVFPEGMQPNVEGTTNPLTTPVSDADYHLNLSITGQTVLWGVINTNGYGAYTGGTLNFQVNVTNTGLVGEQTINYTFYGDGYSSEPHTLNGSLVILEALEHDLGIVDIVPIYVFSDSTVTPQVTIRNMGISNEATWSLTLTDGDAYTSTKSDVLINAGEGLVVDMDDWAPVDGNYTLTATLTLADDGNISNNTKTINVKVGGYLADAYVLNASEGTYNTVNLTDGSFTYLKDVSIEPFPMSEEFDGNYIYRVYEDFTYGTVDPIGGYTQIGTMTGVDGTPTGLAYDWINGHMYLMVLNDSDLPQLCTVDLTTGALTLIGTGTEGMIISMDFANDGLIYGPGLDDNLYSIDPATGATTVVGSLGININYGQDVSYDAFEDKLYTYTSGEVYKFGYYDLTTGAFNPIANTVDESQISTFVVVKSGDVAGAMITFNVKNAEDTPIQGALVEIDGKQKLTDELGVATIFVLEGNDIEYTVSKFAYEPATATINVVDEVTQSINVVLTAAESAEVTFTIQDESDQALENAEIEILFDGTIVEQGASNATGQYVVSLPINNTYTYNVSLSGFTPVNNVEFELTHDTIINVKLVEQIIAPSALGYQFLNRDTDVLFYWNSGWAESFEVSVPPADWSAVVTNTTESWKQVGTVSFSEGDLVPVDGSFQAELYWDYGHQDEWLKTYEFSVPTNGELVFWSYIGAKNSEHGDNYYVKISTDGGSTWTVLWNAVTDNINATATYEEHTVNLSSYVGQNVMLAWHAIDGDGQGLWFAWFIDKVEVRKSGAKAFEGYNVYLNNEKQNEDPVTDTEYIFQDLQPGDYTAGVSSVYTSESEIVTIDFTILPPSEEANILTYTIPNQVGTSSINATEKTVKVTVPYGTNVTNLVATFTLSDYASAKVGTTDQVSGSTANDFTNPVVYTITAEAGNTKDWTVTVVEAPASTEAKILTYSFAEQYAAATVDNANSKVDIKVKENTDVTALVATFTLSDGATAQVGGVDQISGTTANDFTNPVTYKVTAQDGTTTRDWTINVSIHSGIETAESSAITIYPNPSNGRFTLDFGDINGKVNYQIFDTKGSIILSDNFVANGSAIQEVSLNLVSGIYFVKLVTETQSIIEKLVIE